jgi:hypothetical protein
MMPASAIHRWLTRIVVVITMTSRDHLRNNRGDLPPGASNITLRSQSGRRTVTANLAVAPAATRQVG